MADYPGAPDDPLAPFAPALPPDLVWPPPEWGDLAQIGAMTPGTQPEESAGPVPSAADVAIAQPVRVEQGAPRELAELAATGNNAGSPLQPGLGIPTATLDALNLPSADQGPPTPPDPWATGPAILDEDRLAAQLHEIDRATDRRVPEQPADYATTEELGAGLALLARTDPVAYAQYKAAKDAEQGAFIANQRAKALHDDTEWLHRNVAAAQDAQKRAVASAAQLDDEAKKLSADGGFWESRTTGQKLAAGIMAVVGGLVAGRTGGPNQGLQLIDQAVERHVAAQRARFAARRDAVGRMRAAAQSDFALNEMMRLAAWKGVENELLTKQQQFDPRGTRARYIADQVLAAQEKQAEIRSRYQTAEQKRLMEVAKFELDRQKAEIDARRAAEQERANKAQERLSGWRTALDAKRLTLDEKERDRRYSLDERKLDADTAKALQQRADELAKLDRELGVGGVKRIADGGVKYGSLVNADGSVYHAPDAQAHAGILKSRQGVLDLLDTLADLKKLRDNAGGASKLTSPSDQAEYKRLTNRAIIAYATANGLSLADEQSQKFTRDAIIGDDPSGYNVGDVIDRIDRSMDATKNSYYNQLQGAGYTGPKEEAIQFVDTYKAAKPEETEEERTYREMIAKPRRINEGSAYDQAEKIARERYAATHDGSDPFVPKKWVPEDTRTGAASTEAQRLAAVKQIQEEARKDAEAFDYKEITPNQRRYFQSLGVEMKYGQDAATRERARKWLTQALEDGGAQTPALRDFIRNVVIQYGGEPATVPVTGSSSSTARDTLSTGGGE